MITDKDRERLQAISQRFHNREQAIEIGGDILSNSELKQAEELRADRYAIDAALDALGDNPGIKMQKALGDTILGAA